MRTSRHLRNAKMTGMARYKMFKTRYDMMYYADDIRAYAKMEAAMTPPEVWQEMPPDKIRRTLELLESI